MATLSPERLQSALDVLPARLREVIAPQADRLDIEMIARAYQTGERAHSGQRRASGEDYVVHCIEVARILAELHLDSSSITAGLLHDVVEDTLITVDSVR